MSSWFYRRERLMGTLHEVRSCWVRDELAFGLIQDMGDLGYQWIPMGAGADDYRTADGMRWMEFWRVV